MYMLQLCVPYILVLNQNEHIGQAEMQVSQNVRFLLAYSSVDAKTGG